MSEDEISKTRSWPDLAAALISAGGTPTGLRLLRSLRARLDRDNFVEPEAGDEETAQKSICTSTAKLITPDHSLETEEGSDADIDEEAAREALVKRCKNAAHDGLAILEQATSLWNVEFDTQTLLTLVAFTDSNQPWASGTVAALACEILDKQLAGRDKAAFIADDILQSYLRPLFSKSRPATVTASGRKAEYPEPGDPHRGLENETPKVKPWKYADLRAVPVFTWAVSNASEKLVSQHWPLFIPVLLTLLDDPSTPIRVQGLRNLHVFLQIFPKQTLQNTGLQSVFEDAVFPTLMFLPRITPEDESLQLLEPAYTALLDLAERAKDETARNKLFDKILREGVFAAYFHSKEHVRIVEVLVTQTELLVKTMGLQAVKHLKDLMPMLSEIMIDPFATTLPSRLLVANRSLQAIMAACWPRLVQQTWQNETIRILTVCWLNVLDKETPVQHEQDIRDALVQSASMLTAVLEASGVDTTSTIQPLIDKEPRLADLFASD